MTRLFSFAVWSGVVSFAAIVYISSFGSFAFAASTTTISETVVSATTTAGASDSAHVSLLQSLRTELAALESEIASLEKDKTNTTCSPVSLSRTLTIGSHGSDVSSLQEFLRWEDFYSYPTITGYFGPVTEKAVADFQNADGIDPIGIVGPQTRAKISAVSALCTAPQTKPQVPPETATSTAVVPPGTADGLPAALQNYTPGFGGGAAPATAANATTPDTTPPTVSFTAPASGASVFGSVTLTATASDNVAVSKVQFEVDGTAIGSALTSSPYTTTWNSTSLADGTHTLTAVAKDSSGNYATSTETVTVDQGEVQVLGTQIGSVDSNNVANTNLLEMSSALNAPIWTEWYLSSVTGGQSDPNSGTTAFGLTESSDKAVHRLIYSLTKSASAQTYTVSVYAKKALRTRIILSGSGDFYNPSSSGANAVFDLSGGTVVASSTFGSAPFSHISAAITPAGNGYYRCALTFTTNTVGELDLGFVLDSGSGTGATVNYYAGNSGATALYLYGPQLEAATSAGGYVATTGNGQTLSNLVNGSFASPGSTWWMGPDSQSWAGVDAGAGNSPTWTRYRFAPRPGSTANNYSPSLDFEFLTVGDTVQTSSDPAFGSGGTTVDTVPTSPYTPRFQLTERTLSGSSRAIRLLSAPGSYGSLAQLQFFAKASTIGSAAAAPVAPVISPWGGRYVSGTTTVTLSSLTKNAKIYYTTDGTTPSNTNGTLYAGPFTLSMGGVSTTLKAVAYDASLSTPLSAVESATFEPWGFKPRDNWYDNNGNLIEAHSGDIMYVNGVYYLYGLSMNSAMATFTGALANPKPRFGSGVWMYSSTDLYNWKLVGNIIQVPNLTIGGTRVMWISRPHILYNAANNDYVMWTHMISGDGLTVSSAAIATSSSITGPWSWAKTNYSPDGGSENMHDFTLFEDTDGTAYVVYKDATSYGITISQLSSDYLSTTGTNKLSLSYPAYREAPVMFKKSGVYFLLTTLGDPYDSTQAMAQSYQTNSGASPTANSWSGLTSLFATDPTGTDYNVQETSVLQLPGTSNYLMIGDYWVQSDVYQSRQDWLPLSFTSSTAVQAQTPSSWDILGTFGSY